MDDKDKLELSILQKEYEMVAKAYDEMGKLFLGVPAFIAALMGGAYVIKDTFIHPADVKYYLLLVSFTGFLLIIIFWGSIIREQESLQNYRAYLEKKINAYFDKDLIGFTSEMIELKKRNWLGFGLFTIVIGIICLVFEYFIFKQDLNSCIISGLILSVMFFGWLMLNYKFAWKPKKRTAKHRRNGINENYSKSCRIP